MLYQGWTASYPEHLKLQNRLESALSLLAEDPGNPYWQNEAHFAERALLRHYGVSVRPAVIMLAMPARVPQIAGG